MKWLGHYWEFLLWKRDDWMTRSIFVHLLDWSCFLLLILSQSLYGAVWILRVLTDPTLDSELIFSCNCEHHLFIFWGLRYFWVVKLSAWVRWTYSRIIRLWWDAGAMASHPQNLLIKMIDLLLHIVQHIDGMVVTLIFSYQRLYLVAKLILLEHSYCRVRVYWFVKANSCCKINSLDLLSYHLYRLFVPSFTAYREPFFYVNMQLLMIIEPADIIYRRMLSINCMD